MKEFTLDANQRRVTKVLHKDSGRPVMECVQLRPNIIEATDGFVLIQKHCDYNDNPLLLNFQELNQCKDFKADKINQPVTFNLDDDTGLIKADGKFTNLLNPVEGTYPKTDPLFPTKIPVFDIYLAKSRLKALLEAFDNDEEKIHFVFYGREDQAKLENIDGTTKAIIMPMKAH